MKAFLWLIGLAAVSMIAPTGLPMHAAERPTIFAAASLKEAMEAAGADFTRRTGIDVVFAFAGTAALTRQLQAGAPADLFVSADTLWMDYARQRGLVDPNSVRTVAGNALVLVAPTASAQPVDLTDRAALAARLGEGRLAIGDPDTVPAGRYGRAALMILGLWEVLETRIAPMENVRVALAAVARGDVPLGVVYASDAGVEPDVAVVARFPANSHPAIIYQAALTPSGRPAAAQFLAFLTSEPGRAALVAAGLQLPD